jgi:hypothetical protein
VVRRRQSTVDARVAVVIAAGHIQWLTVSPEAAVGTIVLVRLSVAHCARALRMTWSTVCLFVDCSLVGVVVSMYASCRSTSPIVVCTDRV